MPMTKQERDDVRKRLVALKAAEEVEAVIKLLRKDPANSQFVLRLTRLQGANEWQQLSSQSVPYSELWRRFARDLEEALEAYGERLFAMAKGEKETGK